MAKPQNPTQTPQNTAPAADTAPPAPTRGAGRPPKDPSISPATRAKANLQAALDQADQKLSLHPDVSVAARIARCARAGVPRETAEKVVAALDASLAEVRQAVERAYAPRPERAPATRRVTL